MRRCCWCTCRKRTRNRRTADWRPSVRAHPLFCLSVCLEFSGELGDGAQMPISKKSIWCLSSSPKATGRLAGWDSWSGHASGMGFGMPSAMMLRRSRKRLTLWFVRLVTVGRCQKRFLRPLRRRHEHRHQLPHRHRLPPLLQLLLLLLDQPRSELRLRLPLHRHHAPQCVWLRLPTSHQA